MTDDGAYFVAVMVIVGILGLTTGTILNQNKMERGAIEHNVAEYNAQTGDFEWKECER